MVYIIAAIFIMIVIEAIIIIPDKIPVVRNIRRKVKK